LVLGTTSLTIYNFLQNRWKNSINVVQLVCSHRYDGHLDPVPLLVYLRCNGSFVIKVCMCHFKYKNRKLKVRWQMIKWLVTDYLTHLRNQSELLCNSNYHPIVSVNFILIEFLIHLRLSSQQLKLSVTWLPYFWF
jgi:coenzyme F420-reducing hydrogenase delta subunit